MSFHGVFAVYEDPSILWRPKIDLSRFKKSEQKRSYVHWSVPITVFCSEIIQIVVKIRNILSKERRACGTGTLLYIPRKKVSSNENLRKNVGRIWKERNKETSQAGGREFSVCFVGIGWLWAREKPRGTWESRWDIKHEPVSSRRSLVRSKASRIHYTHLSFFLCLFRSHSDYSPSFLLMGSLASITIIWSLKKHIQFSSIRHRGCVRAVRSHRFVLDERKKRPLTCPTCAIDEVRRTGVEKCRQWWG